MIPNSDDSSVNKAFTIMHINIQCLRNKIHNLEVFLYRWKPMVICICEHWLKSDEINLYIPDGYIFVNSYCRTEFKNGGTCIFIKVGISYNLFDFTALRKFLKFLLCY